MTTMESMFADVRSAEDAFNSQLRRQFGSDAVIAKYANDASAFDNDTRTAYYTLIRRNRRLNRAAMRMLSNLSNIDGEAA